MTGKRVVKNRLVDSEKVRQKALRANTRRLPIAIKGLPEPKMVVLSPKQLEDIRVDTDRYQRVRSVDEVNTLIHVLKDGGSIPDPVTLSRRPDGSIYVVDGQQRFWAHVECGAPMRALIYDVPSVAVEQELFIVLNSTRTVNANVKVHAWTGPVATYIRTLAMDKDSPYFGRVNFGSHPTRTYAAANTLKGIMCAMTGLTAYAGTINEFLRRSDVAWTRDALARDRARGFLELVARVFGPRDNEGFRGTAKAAPLQALGLVAFSRWQRRVEMPSEYTINALRKINWNTIAPAGQRFFPVLRAEIDRRWKA